jgi:hypothetical protein
MVLGLTTHNQQRQCQRSPTKLEAADETLGVDAELG